MINCSWKICMMESEKMKSSSPWRNNLCTCNSEIIPSSCFVRKVTNCSLEWSSRTLHKRPSLHLGALTAGTPPRCGLGEGKEESWVKVTVRAFIHSLNKYLLTMNKVPSDRKDVWGDILVCIGKTHNPPPDACLIRGSIASSYNSVLGEGWGCQSIFTKWMTKRIKTFVF